MADAGAFPNWLLKSKDQIVKTAEWSSFIEALYDAIEQQLTEGDVQSFTDLTDSERKLFLERASHAIHDGVAHHALQAKVSSLLNRHLNSDVARQLMEDFPVTTKTDLILDNAQEGIIGLLKKWPDMISKLHTCFNQPLPPKLRRSIWKLYLKNDKVMKLYAEILAHNPRVAISPMDLDISAKCEKLLMTEPTFADLNGSVGAFYAMKAVLSYHHAVKKTRDSLPLCHFLLAVPFVRLMAEHFSRKEPASGRVVTLLVEEYFSLMNILKGYTGVEELNQFSGTTAKFLFDICPELGKQMADTFIPSDDMIVTTEAGIVNLLQDAMLTIATPILAAMFVSYVNMDVVLFIWDQYFITSDVAGFHKQLLPALMAVLFKLLRHRLKDCDSRSSYETKVKAHGPELHVRQFQHEMKKHFFAKLQPALTEGDRVSVPALNVTEARHLPWEQWGGEPIPPYTTAEDRRRVREDRVAEKQGQRERQREEVERRRREEERERSEEEDQIAKRMKEEKLMTERERRHLEDLLNEERRKRETSEQKAASDIEKLQREIEMLKRYQTRSPGLLLRSTESLYRHLRTNPSPAAARTPTPRHVNDSIVAFLSRVSQSFKKIANGDGADRALLEQHTRVRLQEHAEDVKMAEREVFGRELNMDEFEGMPESEKCAVADRIMQLGEQRRQREMNAADETT